MLRNLMLLMIILAAVQTFSQTGISVSPPRNYFITPEGAQEIKKILVTNLSKTNTLDLSVSLNDWEYNNMGHNLTYVPGTLSNSCANWITVLPNALFSLAPGESTELELLMQVPEDIDTTTNEIRTAMLYINQINPTQSVDEHGVNIMVSVRSGIKIYHKLNNQRNPEIEATNFLYNAEKNRLELEFKNTGNIWTDGDLKTTLLFQETGKEIRLENQVFYTLPKDVRVVHIPLPKGLEKGNYIVSTMFEYSNEVKIAELHFDYE